MVPQRKALKKQLYALRSLAFGITCEGWGVESVKVGYTIDDDVHH